MSVPTSDMTTAIFSEAQGNIFDDPASKSTFGNNLTAYTSQSDNAETNTFSEASENTDSTYEMPHISEVYSLSNVNNDSLSSYNPNDFNIPTTESVKSSSETLHIDLTKDKCLEKFKISNTEAGNSNVKDFSSHMDNESQACSAMSKDLSAHSNESVKDHVLEKYNSDLIPASSANVEAKDTSSVEMSRADSLGNDNKLAEPVLSNSDDIESSRDIKPDLNSLNLLIQNSEKNEGLSDSPSNNSLSKPNADVCGNNNLELDRDLPYNNQSIDREVPNFENKLDSSTNGGNFVTATSSYQFPTIPTVPTYILTGNVLMPNTFPYNYVISTPFSNMSLPVSSISYNIQNTNIATTDTSKSAENMPVPPNPVSENVLTLPDGQLDNKSSSEENTLNTPNLFSENTLTLPGGQLESKSNSIDENGCKDKDESSFKKSNVKTYEGRKRKTDGLDKHPCSKRVSKRKLVAEKCMSPSCTSEQNKEKQVEETPTVSEPAVSALQLLSLITGQKEYDDGPDPATENKTKNEFQMMDIKSENVIDISEENVTQSCSAKEILKKIDALHSNDKLNESQKQIDGNFVSKNIEFQHKSHENEFFSSHQIDEVDIKDRESNKVDNKSHENESGIYTDYKLQNMPCVMLTQLDEYEIQKNELLSSLAHGESVKNQSNNSKVKMQKNNKLKPKSCENESFSSGQTHDIKDQNSIRKVKSQKTNKLEDEYNENESFSNHQTHDIKDQNNIRKVKSQKTNKLENEYHENESFSSHQTHEVHIKNQNSDSKIKSQDNSKSKCKSQENKSFSSYEVDIKDKNSNSKSTSHKTNKLKDESRENKSFSNHQTHEVYIKNQNSNSKVKPLENKSKYKTQESKSFSSYELDIKDKNRNSKVKSQKTNKLKDEFHENKSFSSHQTHELHIKNQNSNDKLKTQENKSICKSHENRSFSSYEEDVKDKNSNSKVKSQKTNKLKDEFHENKSFSSHQTDELHIKNQNSNSKLKTQENDKSICKSHENRSFSSYEVDVKDKNSNSKIKSQKTNKLKDESHENKSFSSHQTHELHIKNQNSNSKVKSQENNKSKCKSRENKSFSSQEVDIKDQNSNNKVKSQKVNKLKNEYFRIHQTHEVHIKNQDGNTKVKSLENNKLKRKSHEKEYFSSHEIDIKDQNSNSEVKSQKGKKLKDESRKNEFFRSHQTSEAHIKDQNVNNKVKSRKSNKVKHESYKNESLSSHQTHEIDANDSNSNSKVEYEKNKKLKHELHENEFFSSHQISEVHIKDQNVNNKVKSQKSNKLKHESYKKESLSSHHIHEIDANDSNSNSKVESEKSKKWKYELHENESFSSHQINEIDIKDQNSASKVKSQENTMIQVFDKDKKSAKQKEAVQNCKETVNLKKMNNKQSEDQNILPGVSEELAENKNDASQKEKQSKIIKTESCQKSIKCQKGESASSLNCNRALRSKISCKLYEIESHKNIKLKHELHEKESFSSHQINEGDIKDQNSDSKVKLLENIMIQVYDKVKKSPKQKEAVQNCKETNNLKKMNNKQSEDQNILPGVSEELAENKNDASQKEKQEKIIKTESCQKSIKCQKGESASSLNCNRALRSKISCKLYEIESHKNIKLKHELHEKEYFSSHQINERDIKDQKSDSKIKSPENTIIQVYDKSLKQKEAVQNCKEMNNLKKMNNKQSEDILTGVSEELAENKNDASQKEKQSKIIKTESCQKSIKCQKGESASSLNCNRALRSKILCKLYEIESHKNIKLKHELHEKESFSSHQINEGDIKDQNSDSKVKSLENTMIQVYDKDKKSPKQKEAVQNCKETNNLKKLNNKQSEDQNILPGVSEELAENKNDASQKEKQGKIIKTESGQKSIKCQKGESASSLDCNRAFRSKISCKLYEIESHKNIKCQKSKNRPNCNRLLLPKISLQKITIHSMEQNVKNSSSKKFSSIDQNKSFIHNEDNYLKATNKYERLNYFRIFRNSNIVQEKSDHEQYSCNLSLDLSSVSSLEDQYPKTLNYTEKDCSLKQTGNPELLSHSSFESPSIDQESIRSATLVISTGLILQNGIDTSSSSNEFNSEVFPSLTQTEGLVFQTKPTVQNLVQNAVMVNSNGNDSLSNGFNSKVFPSLTQTENLAVQVKPAVQNAVMLNCNGNGSSSNEFNSKVFPSLTQTEDLVFQTKCAAQNLVQNAVMLNCNGNGSSSNEFNSKVFPSLIQTENLVVQAKPAVQNLVQNAVMLNCNGNGSLSNEFNSKVFPSLTQTEGLVFQTKPLQNLVQNAVMLNCNGNDSLSNEFNSKVFPLIQTENLVVQAKPAVQNLEQNTQMLNCNEDSKKCGNLPLVINTEKENNSILITDARQVLSSSQNDFINIKEGAKKIKLRKCSRTKKINDKFPSRRLIIKKTVSSYSGIIIHSQDICKSIKDLSLHNVSKKISVSDSNVSTKIPEVCSVSENGSNDVNEAGLQNTTGRKRKLENSCDVSNRLEFDSKITQFSDCNSSKRAKQENCVEPVLSSDSGLSESLYKNTKFNNEVIQLSNCDSSKSIKKQNCIEPSLSLDSCIGMQKNYKQSFHSSFLSENTVNKEIAGKNILCSNHIYKDSNCQNMPCVTLTKSDEHSVHSLPHKLDHNIEEKNADCRNHFEQTTKTVSEGNAKMLSQNSDGSILSKYLYRSKMECIGMQKKHKQSFHSSFLSENTVKKEVAVKNILCSNHVYKDSKCQNMPCVTLIKSDERGVHSLPHKLDHNIEEKNANCRNNFEQTTKTVLEGNAKMLSQNPDGSILSQYLCRSKMECIGMQENYKQSFHSSFLSENTVNKEIAGKNILCSNHIYKDSKCPNMPCVTLTKSDEHGVHSLPHKLDHKSEEKNADCRNHFEQTTKTVSEGNAKILSQNSDGSILSYSLKVSVHNVNNICDNNRKETVETNMETSGKKNNDVSLAFTSCEKQLVKSQSNNTSSHLPKNTYSIDTVCDNNSASLETGTKNPIVSTEDESNSSRKVPPQWDIIQGAIEKYGCDYILSKINHYLNC